MILQFEGFEISPIHEGDAWKICDFAIANTDRLKRFFPVTLSQNLNPTLSKLYVQNRLKAFQNKETFVFTVKDSETRKLAGLVILKNLDWNTKQGEFAYAIDYNFSGQGLMSKAVKLLSKFAFDSLKLERLQIIVHKENVPSVNVATNNNYSWKKTLKAAFTPNGENPLDMELYELYKH